MANGRVIIACSEISFGGDSYRIKICQFIFIPNQLTGFGNVRVSTEGNYSNYEKTLIDRVCNI